MCSRILKVFKNIQHILDRGRMQINNQKIRNRFSKFLDLTNGISKEMLVYPGDPQPEFKQLGTVENDGYSVTEILIRSHIGTHIDAQSHVVPKGDSIDKEPVDKYIGEAIVFDFSKKENENISSKDLDDLAGLKENDILLFYTGFNDKLKLNSNILYNFSYLDPSAAQWIVDNNVKCIGIDTFSVEKYGSLKGESHKILLSNKIGIIENLNSNLQYLIGKRIFLVCLPLLIQGMDGCPSRAIAFEI